MKLSFDNIFSKENLNLIVNLLTLLIILWVIMFAIPNLFFTLFHTFLGNLVLFAFIILTAMYNVNMSFGLAVIFIILYRFSHITTIETIIL